jgi:hypothetical protein
MTKFITDGYSFGLNVDHIRKIEISKARALVTYHDQESESFRSDTADYRELRKFLGRLDDDGYHTVPAAPGYTLLTFLAPPDAEPDTFDIKSSLDRSAVIAWQIYDDSAPFDNQRAIAVDGDSRFYQEDSFGRSAVLAPDGVVFAADYRLASLDEWITELRENWKESRVRARRAAVKIVHDRGGVRS